MARLIRNFDSPRRAVVGTVGLPGERTFYVQADDGDDRVWIRVEKQQIATLAEQMKRMCSTLIDRGFDSEAPPVRDDRPLDTPVEEEFAAVAIGLGWDEETERIVIELHALGEQEPADFADDDEDAADTIRIRFAVRQAEAFADRAIAVVAAGRPVCPFCQSPLEPSGHICPRANGYRRHSQ